MMQPMRKIPASILLILLLAGCVGDVPEKPATPPEKADQPEMVARMFFDYLHDGDYQAAADLYEGSYEFLEIMNPDFDPNDHPALLAQGCQINGFVCMQMAEVVSIDETIPEEIHMMIQFHTENGDVFVRSPCCGAGEDDMSPVSEFPIRVIRDEGGSYKILDLPPFVP